MDTSSNTPAQGGGGPGVTPASDPSISRPGITPAGSGQASGSGKSAAWKGKTLGTYKLIGFLGVGGMGKVFRAEDIKLKRHVALKVISTRGKKEAFWAQQFIVEARSAATLDHPNVVQIYHVDQIGELAYIAMELIEGGNLSDMIREGGPMDVQRACQLTAEAAEALHYGHQHGIVHRDVKPSNLMITRSGRCKVMDFGLAKFDDPTDTSHAMPSERVGTPQYVAPEVIQGHPADARSDTYSLACALWYLLTGQHVFPAKDVQEAMRRHVHDKVPDIRAVAPHVPESLARALTKGLAKAPEDRFTSCDQFSKVLRAHTVAVSAGASGMYPAQPSPVAAYSSDPTMASMVGMYPGYKAPNNTQRNILIGAVLGLVVVAMLAIVYIVVFLGGPTNPAPVQPPVVIKDPTSTSGGSTGRGNPGAGGPAVDLAAFDPAPTPVETMPVTDPRISTLAQAGSTNIYRIEGTVREAETSRSGKVFRIEFEESGDFVPVYFPGVYAAMQTKFGGENGSGMTGKKIAVIGKLETYMGSPQIVVENPNQIELIPGE